eukprot:1856551-Rhodomonas_salina.1
MMVPRLWIGPYSIRAASVLTPDRAIRAVSATIGVWYCPQCSQYQAFCTGCVGRYGSLLRSSAFAYRGLSKLLWT